MVADRLHETYSAKGVRLGTQLEPWAPTATVRDLASDAQLLDRAGLEAELAAAAAAAEPAMTRSVAHRVFLEAGPDSFALDWCHGSAGEQVLLTHVRDNQAQTQWRAAASGSLVRDEAATEADVLVSPEFSRALDLVRAAGVRGELTPHVHNYYQIETIG